MCGSSSVGLQFQPSNSTQVVSLDAIFFWEPMHYNIGQGSLLNELAIQSQFFCLLLGLVADLPLLRELRLIFQSRFSPILMPGRCLPDDKTLGWIVCYFEGNVLMIIIFQFLSSLDRWHQGLRSKGLVRNNTVGPRNIVVLPIFKTICPVLAAISKIGVPLDSDWGMLHSGPLALKSSPIRTLIFMFLISSPNAENLFR